MSVRYFLLLLFLHVMHAAIPAVAQGYAGLGTAVEGYAEVTRPAALAFPRDHGPHPAFRLEWWYLTAALTGDDGRDYGVQWTLFRVATEPGPEPEGWASRQMWIAHAALTTPDRHFRAERYARGGIGQAGVTAAPFAAWLDDWEMRGAAGAKAGGGGDAIDRLTVSARGEGFAYRLAAKAEGPLVLHGEAGFSLKAAEGQASYYYSQPFYRVEATLELDGRTVRAEGTGWLDREWSSQHMSPAQTGWDWFSLHLDDGDRVMAYRLRDADGGGLTFGTWATPSGETRALAPGAVTMTPTRRDEVAGRRLPVAWRLEIPEEGLKVDTEPVNAQSWMDGDFPYWEGPIRVEGSHRGRGYLEMVGY